MLLFWRVYAVVYLVLVIVGLPHMLSRGPHLSPIDLIDMALFTPIAVVGLWSAAYRHLSLPKNAWKVLLFVSVFWRPIALGNAVLFGDAIPRFQADLGAVIAKASPAAGNLVLYGGMAAAFVGVGLFTLPPLMALYRNAYGDESLLRLMSPSRMTSSQTVA